MRTIIVDIENRETVVEIEIGSVAPITGDIFIYPDKGDYRVVQRAFILEKVVPDIKVIDIQTKRRLEPVLQIAVKRLIPSTTVGDQDADGK